MRTDRQFRIGKNVVGDPRRAFVIAEAGSNHNGDFSMAKRLIAAAAQAGADAVKFQLFTGAGLSAEPPMQKVLDRFAFPRFWFKPLFEYARHKNVLLTATPFDLGAVDLMKKVGVPFYKIASCDLTHLPLIRAAAETGRLVVVSVGLGSLAEIREAVRTIRKAGNRKIALLQCTVSYPAKIEETNLSVIDLLRRKFRVPVGLSDHTMDPLIPALSLGFGASVIEKHLTLSRKMKGPDHSFALEPREFKTMVETIRKAGLAFGPGNKISYPSEKNYLRTGRRGIYARMAIPAGTRLRPEMLSILRPRRGIEPRYFPHLSGWRVKRDLAAFEPVGWSDLI